MLRIQGHKVINDGAQTSRPNPSPSEYSIRIPTKLQTGPTEGVLVSLAYITLYHESQAMRGPPVSIETTIYIHVLQNALGIHPDSQPTSEE